MLLQPTVLLLAEEFVGEDDREQGEQYFGFRRHHSNRRTTTPKRFSLPEVHPQVRIGGCY
jgi:hypothetical protein